jgi:hypothetical protein
MKPVYVNGNKHKCLHDAILTIGGTYPGICKAISLGLPYLGYRISYSPPEPVTEKISQRGKGPLIRNIQVTP